MNLSINNKYYAIVPCHLIVKPNPHHDISALPKGVSKQIQEFSSSLTNCTLFIFPFQHSQCLNSDCFCWFRDQICPSFGCNVKLRKNY